MNMREVAQQLNIPYTTYVNYEKGAREPNSEMLIQMADFHSVSVDYLLGRTESRVDERLLDIVNTIDDDILAQSNGNLIIAKELQYKRDNKFPPPNITEDYTTFPVYADIAAGYESVGIENWEGETVNIPNEFLKGRSRDEFLVLRVKGNSMFPTYIDGDRVLILKQTTLNYSGQVGAVIYDDEFATLKKVEYITGEDWMRLVPINPNVESELIEGERLLRCRILGIPKLLIREISH